MRAGSSPAITSRRSRRAATRTNVFRRAALSASARSGGGSTNGIARRAGTRRCGSRGGPMLAWCRISIALRSRRARLPAAGWSLPCCATRSTPSSSTCRARRGSGLTDGGTMRVAFDGKSGHAYTSIGRLAVERGLLARDDAHKDGLEAWLKATSGGRPRAHAREPLLHLLPRDATRARTTARSAPPACRSPPGAASPSTARSIPSTPRLRRRAWLPDPASRAAPSVA